MNTPEDNTVVEVDVDRLRKALFGAAKWRWGTGVILGHTAVIVVPVALWLDHPRWIGLTIAATMSVLGTVLRWWSESVRGDADRLHRANEMCSIGQPTDPVLVSDIMVTYPRLVCRIPRKKNEDDPYFEAQGDPSTDLLVLRLRESARWTEKLATKAKRLSYFFGCISAIAISASFVAANSVEVRAYAMAICAIVLVDIFHLGSRYGNLAASCARAYSRLDTLHGNADLTEREALIEANSYQSARDAGPLIPGWIWWLSRKDLQAAWKPLSTVHEERR